MPRPNKPRDVLAEEHLAQRIAAERDARGWTNDGLAKRMTDVGCAMSGSAIFKIEKGEPRRRIVVDELVAFAKVFGVPVDELLLSPELAVSKAVADLVIDWEAKRSATAAAKAEQDEAWNRLREYAQTHHEAGAALEQAMTVWAEYFYDEPQREAALEQQMYQLTGDSERWQAWVRRALEEND